MKVTLDTSKDGRNLWAVLEVVASRRPHPVTVLKMDQLHHQSFDVSIAFGLLGQQVLILITVADFVYIHQHKGFRIDWRLLRNGHKDYGLMERRLGENCTRKVKAMD